MKRLVTLASAALVVWLSPPPLAAQDDVDITEVSAQASRFLRDLGEDPTSAFETLLAGSDLEAESEEIQRLTGAAKQHPEKYGAFVAAERISARRVGKDLVLLTYLYKAERFPVVWRFAFYRPRENASWAVVSLRFDSKLLELESSE